MSRSYNIWRAENSIAKHTYKQHNYENTTGPAEVTMVRHNEKRNYEPDTEVERRLKSYT